MAHYDCGDCGASMGIAYGSCDECTPRWVKEAQRNYNKISSEVDDKVDEFYALEQLELDKKKALMHNQLTEESYNEYVLIFEAGRDWYENGQKT
jgi:predicted ATP-dependent serine protease